MRQMRAPTASVKDIVTAEKIYKLSVKGASQHQVAAMLGISRSTLHEYFKKDSSLRDAYERGKANDVLDVVQSLKTMAVEKNNAVAAIFYLKNRDPENWRDKHDHHIQGNVTLNVATFDDDKCIDMQDEPVIDADYEVKQDDTEL